VSHTTDLGKRKRREQINEVVDELRRVITIWDEGRYSCDDFANQLDRCMLLAEEALDTPEKWERVKRRTDEARMADEAAGHDLVEADLKAIREREERGEVFDFFEGWIVPK
jgi:hypothetical protein